jgi:hypothetical protein
MKAFMERINNDDFDKVMAFEDEIKKNPAKATLGGNAAMTILRAAGGAQ